EPGRAQPVQQPGGQVVEVRRVRGHPAIVGATPTGRAAARGSVAVGVLVVALDHHDVVVLVEAYVDRVAVGLGDLDLPGRAVLRVPLHAVCPAAAGGLQRGPAG